MHAKATEPRYISRRRGAHIPKVQTIPIARGIPTCRSEPACLNPTRKSTKTRAPEMRRVWTMSRFTERWFSTADGYPPTTIASSIPGVRSAARASAASMSATAFALKSTSAAGREPSTLILSHSPSFEVISLFVSHSGADFSSTASATKCCRRTGSPPSASRGTRDRSLLHPATTSPSPLGVV